MTYKLPDWELLGETSNLKSKVFEVVTRRCLSPKDGREKNFMSIRAPDWCNVAPITQDGRILLVRQFRHGSREISLELPGGQVDGFESPLSTAKRELEEETGYSAQSFKQLTALRPNPALFTNTIYTFVAFEAVKNKQTKFDENEDLAPLLVTKKELKEMILDGRINHALMVAAIASFLLVYPD
ncbi:MAG: NUDIX hydrolase [Deltaproteobacteria bacterium]|jgi:8-oxo-dGTP pyrophosphatase MutT (NUDIX family)|nr:NUDIX hydrolase [Deltaproteobacteria bacterium]